MKKIQGLITLAWEKEQISKEWRKSIMFPIHKKGDKVDCTSYRGIALLYTTYRVFTNILHHRLRPYIENILGEYQG
jgi:hypothetical protein